MKLGTFSVSLAVKDIKASREFYEKFGFKSVMGDASKNWLILKKADYVIAVFQDQPVLRGIPVEDLETELLVEALGSLEVLDGQANRKCSEFHVFAPFGIEAVVPWTFADEPYDVTATCPT